MLKLIRPNPYLYLQYQNMMDEWNKDGSQIAPWVLELPYKTESDFLSLIDRLNEVERGEHITGYSPSSTYWLYDDERNVLVGAGNLRHALVGESGQLWGHIGYGIRPSERRKGYASFLLKSLLEKAAEHGLSEVLLAAWTDNIASWKTMERCGAVFQNYVLDKESGKTVKQYLINTKSSL